MLNYRCRYFPHLFIWSRWVNNLQMSILVFDITQFFPFLNYQLLPLIIRKAGFDFKVSVFFSDYLVGRKTQYLQNNFISSFFNINIDVGQDLCQEYSMKYIYSTSQMSKLSLTLHTFSITSSVTSLFLTIYPFSNFIYPLHFSNFSHF